MLKKSGNPAIAGKQTLLIISALMLVVGCSSDKETSSSQAKESINYRNEDESEKVVQKEEYRKPKASCTQYEAQKFAEKRIAFSGEILDRPVLAMEPVGCRYYFWCNVINRYGGMSMVHIVVSAESGEWEVITVDVE
jgi:hypothetical protein